MVGKEYSLVIENEKIDYYIIKKKIKNMNMRVLEDGKVMVSIPNYITENEVQAFIKLKINWILKQKRIVESYQKLKEHKLLKNGQNVYYLGKKYTLKIIVSDKSTVNVNENILEIHVKERYFENQKYIQELYNKFLEEKCYEYCMNYIIKYCEKMKQYKIPYPNIKIKNFKSRWGCCIPKKEVVEFSVNLIKVPLECLEYVVVHELAHFKFIYHNEKFYEFVSIYIPDWKERRNVLNKVYSKIIN